MVPSSILRASSEYPPSILRARYKFNSSTVMLPDKSDAETSGLD
jgi:hypothetical protein